MITADVKFLQKMGLLDYSLLIAVERLPQKPRESKLDQIAFAANYSETARSRQNTVLTVNNP